MQMKIYLEPEELKAELSKDQFQSLKVGLSHGVFDLVHPGHIQHFIAAKKQVDILIVSITADEFVNKGPGRPIFSEDIRLSTLAALEAVDYVTISRQKTAERIISILKPNFYFKGADYMDSADDPTGKIEAERIVVEQFGGTIKFTDEFTSSSSKLINNILNPFDTRTKNWIESCKKQCTIEEIDYYLDKISELNVSLVGELIIDQYTMVDALGKTSKDPILAFQILETNLYAGGILAIANNCSSWAKSVSVYSMIGDEEELPYEVSALLNPRINLFLTKADGPTITKHRYIDVGTKSKVFETYLFDPDKYRQNSNQTFLNQIENMLDADLVLVADYGHGLMSNQIIEKVIELSKYLAVNVQTNAGNRGLNNISKYHKIDFFTANSRELQLEFRSKDIDFSQMFPKLMRKLQASRAILTLGADGVKVFDKQEIETVPAFATKVIDKVGAGDSVFAISSLLAFTHCPSMIIGLVSNIVAAHEIANLGHQAPLSLGDIKKQIRSLLR
jgi:rfaE bifunctional protein nucleotidyltransferase chain/domain